METNIVRPVEVLRGYQAIGKHLRVGEERVRDFVSHGAPIVFEGYTPRADKAELWEWYKVYCQERGKPCA